MMRPLKILAIADRRFPVSQPFLEEVLAKILPARGHRVFWLLQSDAPLDHVKRVSWHGSEVFLLPSCHRQGLAGKIRNFWMRTANSYIYLRSMINSLQPDIIQVRNEWVAGLFALHIGKRQGIPFVFQYSRPGPGFIMQRYQDATVLGQLGAFMRSQIEHLVVTYIMRRADHVLPITEWMKDDLLKQGIPESHMTAFPLGFNTDWSLNNISGQSVRDQYHLGLDPVVIYFGDMGKLRRLDFLLRVMQIVLRQEPRAKLFMVGGDTEPGDLQWLKAVAGKMGIEDQVIFTGRVSRERVAEFIAASNVGVSPIPPIPIYWISSPTKQIETMAMSRPVVVNDIPEQKKVAADSGGSLCVPYNEQAFAEAILQLLKDKELAEKMGAAGRSYVERERSYHQMAFRLERIYFDLLGDSLAKSVEQ